MAYNSSLFDSKSSNASNRANKLVGNVKSSQLAVFDIKDKIIVNTWGRSFSLDLKDDHAVVMTSCEHIQGWMCWQHPETIVVVPVKYNCLWQTVPCANQFVNGTTNLVECQPGVHHSSPPGKEAGGRDHADSSASRSKTVSKQCTYKTSLDLQATPL